MTPAPDAPAGPRLRARVAGATGLLLAAVLGLALLEPAPGAPRAVNSTQPPRLDNQAETSSVSLALFSPSPA